MCLITNSNYIIAEENIIGYKILYKRKLRFPRAPFMHKLYIRNIKYKLKDLYTIPTCKSGVYKIREGFYCYKELYLARFALLQMQDSWISSENLKLYKCIIPKGSKYYIGSDDGELSKTSIIVSNQIIIKNEAI